MADRLAAKGLAVVGGAVGGVVVTGALVVVGATVVVGARVVVGAVVVGGAVVVVLVLLVVVGCDVVVGSVELLARALAMAFLFLSLDPVAAPMTPRTMNASNAHVTT